MRRYEYKEVRYTFGELLKLSGLEESTLKARLNRGWSVKRAVETPLVGYPREEKVKRVYYEYNGEKLSMRQISEKYNIPLSTLKGRIYRNGWDVIRAIETPARNKTIKPE